MERIGDWKGREVEFSINYVECKSRRRFFVRLSVESFLLTMWNVNQNIEVGGRNLAPFSINYVECKFRRGEYERGGI